MGNPDFTQEKPKEDFSKAVKTDRHIYDYRLVRAGIPAEEWDTFRGDEAKNGEFRVAMLLLAAAAGYPAVARDWFREMRSANSIAMFLSDKPVGRDHEGWSKFKNIYDTTFLPNSLKPPKEMFVNWLDRVERFAF